MLSEKIQAFVAESSIPGSDAHELDEVEAKLAEEQVRLTTMNLKRKALMDKIDKLKQRQRTICPHHHTLDDIEYIEGTYYDRAATIYRTKCARCGTLLSTRETTRSYG